MACPPFKLKDDCCKDRQGRDVTYNLLACPCQKGSETFIELKEPGIGEAILRLFYGDHISCLCAL